MYLAVKITAFLLALPFLPSRANQKIVVQIDVLCDTSTSDSCVKSVSNNADEPWAWLVGSPKIYLQA